MSIMRRNLVLVAALAIVIALGLVTMAVAAADPVTIKLSPWKEGDVTVVDVSVTNGTSSNINVDIKATLPAGAEFAGANPQGTFKVAGANVNWFGKINAGRTAVGYQYKFRATGGTTSVSVSYIGSTQGTVVATLDLAGFAQAAPAAVAATKPPVGKLVILPVPANAADANAIKLPVPGTTSTIALGASGLPNVSIGVPVVLEGTSTDAQAPAKDFAWTLTAPSASKAKLDKNNTQVVRFTPDVVGVYKVDVVVGNEAGKSAMSSVQLRAGTYVGVEQGNCAKCHPGKVSEWAETPHSTKLKREIDGSADPANSHYGENCIRCHTVGYAPGVDNGGFTQVQAKLGYKFPSLESIQSGKAGNWNAVPAALKNLSNIQCENCHGPAAQHVANGAPMAKSLDEGVCNACHNAGGNHNFGAQYANSKHSEKGAQPWTYPTGPTRQACVRCHSGNGFISFLANPTEQSSWDNNPQNPTCGVCHDSHSEANKFQLRIVGKPVEAVGITKDYGLSATCVECHNSRVKPADAQKGSFPHYSSAGELLANMGGVDYGKQIVDSPHGLIVGAGLMKDPRDATGEATLFRGETPGACVACHMFPISSDAKDPNRFKVGGHSFNVVSQDGGVQNTAVCQTCHGTNVNTFDDIKARADYDGNGKNESAQAEVAGLLNVVLKAIEDSGINGQTGHPYFDPVALAKANEKQKNAIFNYRFVEGVRGSEGKSAAIHNFKRSVMLLQLSYKDLTGKDVPNATILQ